MQNFLRFFYKKMKMINSCTHIFTLLLRTCHYYLSTRHTDRVSKTDIEKFLELILQAQTQVECLATHVVVIGVIRIAPIDRHVEIELQAIRQGEPEVGIHHQQRGIALVALVVEIERVGGSQVLALVALPGKNAVVVGSYLEARHLAEIHQADGLHAVAAAHVVVAVYHIIIIGETAAQQDAIHEDALLQFGEIAHLREAVDDAGTHRRCLGDAIWHKTGAILHRLRIVVVEVLEDAELHLRALAHLHRHAPQAAQQMQSRDERLVAAQAEGGIQREVIVWLGGDAIKRVAIYQIESHVWISLATEQRVVIGKIAITR